MNKIEIFMLALASFLILLVISYFYYSSFPIRQMDSVIFIEALDSILKNGMMLSEAGRSVPDIHHTLGTDPDLIACNDLYGHHPALVLSNKEPVNILLSHSYLFLYPLAVLSYISNSLFSSINGSEFIPAIMNGLAHFGMVVIPYIFLRKHKVSIFLSVLFSLIILLYPPLMLSSVGDLYVDKFYMPFMLLLLFLLHTISESSKTVIKIKQVIPLLLLIFLIGSFTERSIIMVVGVLLFFVLFFPKIRQNKNLIFYFIFSVIFLLAYLYYYMNYYQNPAHTNVTMMDSFIAIIQFPLDRLANPKVFTFLLTHFIFSGFGLFLFFAGFRYSLLFFGALLPNILISIGGAELTGWSLHYHAMYIPIVIFVMTIGYFNLTKTKIFSKNKFIFWINYKRAEVKISIFSIFLLIFFVFNAKMYNPYEGKWTKNNDWFGVYSYAYKYFFKPNKSRERYMVHIAQALKNKIPEGSTVSLQYNYIGALFKNRDITIFPVGMRTADYILVSGIQKDGVVKEISGAANFSDRPQGKKIFNECLYKIMINEGYELSDSLPEQNIFIFKK